MTLRSLSLALASPTLWFAVGAVALAGCNRGGASGTADLDDIPTGSPIEQLAYDAGFRMGAEQDSLFSFDRFRDGFNAGLRGDSVEIAYAMGLQLGLSLRADTVANVDPDLFLASFQEGLAGGESRLSDGQVARARALFQDSLQFQEIRTRAAVDTSAQALLTRVERGRAQSDSLFRAIGGQAGVQRTASGVAYRITRPGQGTSPTENDRVRVTYVGRLPNGTEFDRSPEGEPAEMALQGVVPGFSEMLMQMKPGETRTIYLPPEMAYGLQGRPSPDGGGIPPASALVFDVTLVDVLAGMPQMQFDPRMLQGM